MSICCFAKAQSISQGFTGNMVVNTEGGNRFELSFYNHKGADVVSICDWYRNLGQSDMHFSSLGNTISSFKCKRIGIHVLPQKTDQERRLAQFC